MRSRKNGAEETAGSTRRLLRCTQRAGGWRTSKRGAAASGPSYVKFNRSEVFPAEVVAAIPWGPILRPHSRQLMVEWLAERFVRREPLVRPSKSSRTAACGALSRSTCRCHQERTPRAWPEATQASRREATPTALLTIALIVGIWRCADTLLALSAFRERFAVELRFRGAALSLRVARTSRSFARRRDRYGSERFEERCSRPAALAPESEEGKSP